MIGYNAVANAIRNGHTFTHIFVYVDACPYRKGMASLPTGVVMIEPNETDKLTFLAFVSQVIHLIGGDEDRVKMFADRIWMFHPKKIIANWGEAMEIMQ